MKKAILSLFFIFILGSISAKNIPVETAQKIASNFIYEQSGQYQTCVSSSSLKIDNTTFDFIYIINFKNAYVIISSDDVAPPVLGYSLENNFSQTDIPPSLLWLLKQYSEQIRFLTENNISATKSTTEKWIKYSCDFNDFRPVKNTKDVAPLLGSIAWGQGTGWNEYCPVDASGSNGHALTGCVATATSQIMRYWQYPNSGYGSNTYNHETYGDISADFGSTTYNWAEMTPNSPTIAAALLLFHVGVSVDMDYGPDASSASTAWPVYSLVNNFGYKSTARYIRKSEYSESEWENIIKNELDNGRPVLYRGDNDVNGHAFVLDGYNSSGYFHINWGWNGNYNDYFLLSDLTPSTYFFNYDQAAGIGIEPDYTEPAGISATSSNSNIYIKWFQPSFWNRYASLKNTSNYNWATPERAIKYDNEDFNFTYPAKITGVSHAFYNSTSNIWPDSSFTFKIYDSDGNTLLYESPVLEAKHREEIFHELTFPVTVNNDFYVAIAPVDASGFPSSYSIAVDLGTTHSYKGSAGSWNLYNSSDYSYELIAGVYIAGSGFLGTKYPGSVNEYLIYRDNVLLTSVSGTTFEYSDMSLTEGTYNYKVKAVYEQDTSAFSEEISIMLNTTDISKLSANVNIYPNPATDYIKIETPEKNLKLCIIDMNGRIIISKVLTDFTTSIDVSNYKSGIYLISVNKNGNTFSQKVYINH